VLVFILFQRLRASELDAEVRDLCVNGIVYIMSANMERSVKHFYSRAFSDHSETRLVFLAVCARALRKGPKIENTSQSELNASKHRLADVSRFNIFWTCSDMSS
jgi:hypothetical protein